VIRALERPGIVTGTLLDDAGKQYGVVWWHEGERKQEWLFDFEIKQEPP